ncbi:uncharacterized protein DUF3679 [Melghiribacillus thermohalophilus]|uniref:Uncharacterized protein DUF3679 n=1 Tax=Melghiribacillus thermohalophilus TaxID=1324956 RepID=A0A4R3NHT2_9BACI|nr:DUF3679 domain-containing protein [Melghiribacillus thermohalophilus]TCT27038.1 uncharacterized protein DUF3679 [Melghiribacillus thermohalophilus]
MVRFTLLFFLMIILFLSGVIVGFDQAGEGIQTIRGNPFENFDALNIQQSDGESAEVQVMGETFEEMQLKYRDTESEHITEKMATLIEKGVKWLYNQVIQVIYKMTEMIYQI